MSNAFVWFHNGSERPEDATRFYEELLGWKSAAGPGMTMFAGATGPFAGIAPKEGAVAGWVPYVQVDDVDAATARAQRLGATLMQGRTKGPAGDFAVVRDPGGAAIALWQKA